MDGRSRSSASEPLLLVRARTRLCTIPLSSISETLRPLPVGPVPGAPDGVLGAAVLRGETTPVVDLGRLLGLSGDAEPRRWVALRIAGRRVALAVEEVLRIVPGSELDQAAMPPLLRDADASIVRTLAARDRDFLLILDSARLVPEGLLR